MLTKERCVEILNKLNIYRPYIRGFESEKEKVCFYENYAGFWVYQEPEVEAKMKYIEANRNCKVYAITHEYAEFGECWDFLFVPNDESEGECFTDEGGVYRLWSITWNRSYDELEEGDVIVKSFGGGIKRIG